MDARDPHRDELSALTSLVREVRDGQIRLEEQVKSAADHGERIGALELANARTEGSIRVLLWLVPGGPALVGLIGGIAWYATSR